MNSNVVRLTMKGNFVEVTDDLGSLSFPYFHAKKWWMQVNNYGYLLTDNEENEIYVARSYGQGGSCAWLVVWTAPDMTLRVKQGVCPNEHLQINLNVAFGEITHDWVD